MARTIRKCKVDGCDNQVGQRGTARGYCGKHYRRLRLYGSPTLVPEKKDGPVQAWVKQVDLLADPDVCLIWPFYRNPKGYAVWTINGQPNMAHRKIFEIFSGPPPSEELVAAHSCFNGHLGCVNPHHIYWATQSENEMDKVKSGTSNRGSRHGLSKLTESDVLRIREMREAYSYREIADQFEISKWTVVDIMRGRRWGWLK